MVSAEFDVSPECDKVGLKAGAIVFHDVNVTASPSDLRTAMDRAAEDLRGRYPTAAALRGAPPLTGFRQVYTALGLNTKRNPPGCERFLELLWKRGALPSINTLVDAYNVVSVNHSLSVGAHDLDVLALPVRLALMQQDTEFVPLQQSTVKRAKAGEFAYVDARNRVICRLDVIQADFSKVGADTTNVLVIVEGTRWHPPQAFAAAHRELIELVQRYCGGRARTAVWPS
jgi:DNA/RNA-binding domain of Phe-tRNA-synthetase-like protein